MKKLLNLKNIAIAVLVIIILLEYINPGGKMPGRTIKVDGKKYEVIKHDIDTLEVIKDTTIYKRGKDIYHDTTIYVQIPVDKPIDTLAILRDFYAKNVYKDTLHLPDGLGIVMLNDTISQNKILGRSFLANVTQREIKETLIVKELPKAQLYWGFNGGFNKTDVVSNIGTGFILKTKKDKIYQLGVGVANSVTDGTNGKLSPYVGGGIYWKISFKK